MQKKTIATLVIALLLICFCGSLYSVSFSEGSTLDVYPDVDPLYLNFFIRFDPYNKTATLSGYDYATSLKIKGDKTGSKTLSIGSNGYVDYSTLIKYFTNNKTVFVTLVFSAESASSQIGEVEGIEFRYIDKNTFSSRLDGVKALYEKTLTVFQLETQYQEFLAGTGLSPEAGLKNLVTDGSYPSVKAAYLLGLLSYQQKDYSKAQSYFNKIRTLNPNCYLAELAYVNSAVCNELMGNDSAAIEDYKNVVSKYGPESAVAPKALFNLGRIYAKTTSTQKDAFTVLLVLSENFEDSEYGKLAHSWTSSSINAGFSPLLYKELTSWLTPAGVSKTSKVPDGAWGVYDGESIVIENNNVFYNTLVNDSNLQTAYLSGDYNALFASYYAAYQSQVVFTALSKEAKKVGIIAPQEMVNDLIIRSGVYNGKDGNFSSEVYNATSDSEKNNVNTYYTDYFPYYAVISDLQTTIVSEQEATFVESIAKKTRSFEYFVINYLAYPNELAEAYGKKNSNLFTQADISIISTAKEDDINSAYLALKYGASWEETVAAYSEDSYSSNGGFVGTLSLFSITSNMTNAEDIKLLTALQPGKYTAPIAGPNGYSIYRLNSAIKAADFKNSETLNAVKYYINSVEPESVKTYIESAVKDASALAMSDFKGVAAKFNATVFSVEDVSNNIGESQYLGSLATADTNGYLASALNDKNLYNELFTAEKGYVTGALAVSEETNTYVIARVTDINLNNTTSAYVTTLLYNYYAPTQPAYDKFYVILNSNKHVDNFYSQFVNTLFSSVKI